MCSGARENVRRALDEHGFAIVRSLISPADLDTLAEVFRRHEEDGVSPSAEVLFTHAPPPAATPGAPRGMHRLMNQWLNPHRRAAPLTTRAVASALRPIVEGWLGEATVLFQDLLLDKRDEHRPFPWHQDFPFWPVDLPTGLVVWAPLDPADEASGGLCLAQGSHRAGVGPAIDLHTGAPQPGNHGVLVDMTPYEVARPELAPGDVIVFHPLLWHASPLNRSGRRRRAWASTWLGASVRWSHARAPRHPLCKLIEDGAPVGSLGGSLE
jgi:ectoine hydroxylase-related dioxygenase (phytanoyl-CoA dioxygenase family)